MGGSSRRAFLKISGGVAAGVYVGGWFLNRAAPGKSGPLRPPGAGSEARFLARCIRCSQCIQACPSHVLLMASIAHGRDAGTPFVIARENPCELCPGRAAMLCIAACPTAALAPVADRADVRMGTAVVDTETCLPYVGVSCRACWHACPFPDTAISVDDSALSRVPRPTSHPIRLIVPIRPDKVRGSPRTPITTNTPRTQEISLRCTLLSRRVSGPVNDQARTASASDSRPGKTVSARQNLVFGLGLPSG